MSVTAAAGFVAAGVHAGVQTEPGRLDLALVADDQAVQGRVEAEGCERAGHVVHLAVGDHDRARQT